MPSPKSEDQLVALYKIKSLFSKYQRHVKPTSTCTDASDDHNDSNASSPKIDKNHHSSTQVDAPCDSLESQLTVKNPHPSLFHMTIDLQLQGWMCQLKFSSYQNQTL